MKMMGGEAVRDHPMGPKTRPGLFVGYHQHSGGRWSGDYLVMDVKSLDAPNGFGLPLPHGSLDILTQKV